MVECVDQPHGSKGDLGVAEDPGGTLSCQVLLPIFLIVSCHSARRTSECITVFKICNVFISAGTSNVYRHLYNVFGSFSRICWSVHILSTLFGVLARTKMCNGFV